jgi:NADPH-dependent 2,4-dienoyl-CoA reductase/sulfur reductase-like enzyme
MQRSDVLVVGASLAGATVAKRLRANGFGGKITLIGDEPVPPYERPPLSKGLLTGRISEDRLYLLTRHNATSLGIDLVTGERAAAFDPEALTVTTSDGREFAGEQVVIATGAQPKLPVGLRTSERVVTLRTLNDSLRLRDLIEGGELAVIGAGFIGTEVAASAVSMGAEVHLFEQAAVPMEHVLGRAAGEFLLGLHRNNGVVCHMNSQIEQVKDEGDRVALRLRDGSSFTFKAVLVATGVAPATDWLQSSGLPLINGLKCDRYLRVTPDVWAAGDVARFDHERTGMSLRIEHYMNAIVQAEYVADAISGRISSDVAFDAVPYFWSDFYGLKLQMVGHVQPGDEATVLAEPDEAGKGLLVLYSRNGVAVGVLATSRPRVVSMAPSILEHSTSRLEAEKAISALL